MTMFFSKTTNGFYDSDINFIIPEDAVEISNETYISVRDAQTSGKLVSSDDNGNPISIDPPALTNEELATIERSKRDTLITETDFYLMVDYPITEANLILVKEYRKLLRNVPEQAKFPTEIEWPVLTLGS